MIKILDKKNCTGCCACVDICAKSAITLQTDNEGFWYPSINESLCVNCGLCNKVCPVENIPKAKQENFEKPACFAGINKNLYVRFDSTSGGLFSALADRTFREGGLVGGAITDEDFNATQVLIDKKSDLEKLRSSKYYQSNASGFYKSVKAALLSGKKVLVCGMPCQMAALRNFLGKDYENLIIVDLICLCIPSPKVFKKYIEDVGEKYGSPVVATKAKCKELGWRKLTQLFILEDGRHIYQPHDENPFQFFYMNTKTSCRPSCYDCKFKGFPRIADITIGDFWGGKNNHVYTKEFKKEFDNDLGTSVVIVNSQKGLDYLNACRSSLKIKEIPFETVLPGNVALLHSIPSSTINREEFYENLDKHTFTELFNIYNKKNLSGKQRLKKILKRYYGLFKHYKFNVFSYFRLIVFNGFVKTFFSDKNLIIPLKKSICRFANKKNINLNGGDLIIGTKRVKGSNLETRFIVEGSGKVDVKGKVSVGYGADIEVFDGGHLEMGYCWSNINNEIICANSIKIGNYVGMGRNVCIRDNNGGHFINRPFYKDSRPVMIEDKAWICSNVTIMPGVTIGEGAIVGENSFVTENVPPYTMVSGNPAKIVDTDVLYKM
ncbi:Coenzyme F420 hydrogenase/dehydrogenase, beta subunit C-terminal domain [Treponema peruense]|uniref:Coenzyme F420 hydrogenase/dehydrogenase, beta subunit C-terminal domain n=1 Tax=Treponema peruense TaxID=2787628 RepID=A0A7T3RFJ6_9SPIR|nr:Coenzyme F420 hydrogenase/dehydrogenase, beta subunit C-terminal domain [Treponema peruense]QQA02119.1 Coenzyme F420 hydrogenase/dehydrogenase, beta subunit C-terminal domain [Treponema peruense]